MGDLSQEEILCDSVAIDQLYNTEARKSLDIIDSLRELQVGQIVDLPQIIVVGDQSSGKSSVLEAISRVRFPVRGGLCTRFATELVLRRADQNSIDVRIQFATEEPASTNEPAQPFRRASLDRNDLSEIMKVAEERMSSHAGGARGFYKDILRVEIAGSDVPPLTLVDLPGFFHAETSEQSQQDKEMVDSLVESYMRQQKSVILAVISADNQLANQKVLAEAKRHDPKKERTLGVITKPDVPSPGSHNERTGIRLAQGLESMHRLNLGWHALRNRSEGDERLDASARDAQEERFFQTGAWAAIPSSNRGAGRLRHKLSNVLLEHIRRNLPVVIQDIENALQSKRIALESLGPSRSSPEELKLYLIGIAEHFQRISRDGVEGRYNDPYFGDLEQTENKLRAHLRNLNRAFHITMLKKGANELVVWDSDKHGDDDDGDSPVSHHEGFGGENIRIPEYLQGFVDLYDFPEPTSIGEHEFNLTLERLASANRGREFPGSSNDELVIQLFKQQAQPWSRIAARHLNLVTDFAKVFVENLIHHVVGGYSPTVTALLRGCVDPFFDDKTNVLEAKISEIIRPYMSGFNAPLETEYQRRLSTRAVRRLADRMSHLLENGPPRDSNDRSREVPSRKQLIQIIINENEQDSERNEFNTDGIIDRMVAYYDMSLCTFTENVINLAVENCLVCNISDILTATKVHRMSDEELRQLASESDDVQSRRQSLRKEVERLKDALRRCQPYRPRQSTGLSRSVP
ncbi:P-loop containing nucleoside triphosphate hydrolase protein [Pseudomassariella vexata]|uniref:p-loop containing nucleoside triphosphate hydrolase protein n=1 Tax=Pseudomassariella vexata TaxID=1141098 RepID=A0A1Y2E856_9PEZI|nr:P-loop containing nucleoside triphosphate hydrolase protein [Pseudomassariella vexata]ORY67753.1 P-loop containing nucleoside triphosphate hydrolase protein [Pseudomassariella vexata]